MHCLVVQLPRGILPQRSKTGQPGKMNHGETLMPFRLRPSLRGYKALGLLAAWAEVPTEMLWRQAEGSGHTTVVYLEIGMNSDAEKVQ